MFMWRASEESLPKEVSHVHKKAECLVVLACVSRAELVWNEAWHVMQVFTWGPSRLVCWKKLDATADCKGVRVLSGDDTLRRGMFSD